MPPKQPALASLEVKAPTLTVNISPSTCNDLSLFKDIMNQYRKLDDTIIMSLNRANAQFRDLERAGRGHGSVQDQACAHLWKDLVENWKRRTEIVDYCVNVVDRSLEEQRMSADTTAADPAVQRKIQGTLYAETVKARHPYRIRQHALSLLDVLLMQRNQLHNELTVEKIVRNRSLQAFRSRCKYFEPPLTDVQARKWWDAAQASR